MNRFLKVGLLLFLAGPLFAAPKVQSVSFTTRDGWALSASYLPAQADEKTVILLHDLNKKKEEFASSSEKDKYFPFPLTTKMPE